MTCTPKERVAPQEQVAKVEAYSIQRVGSIEVPSPGLYLDLRSNLPGNVRLLWSPPQASEREVTLTVPRAACVWLPAVRVTAEWNNQTPEQVQVECAGWPSAPVHTRNVLVVRGFADNSTQQELPLPPFASHVYVNTEAGQSGTLRVYSWALPSDSDFAAGPAAAGNILEWQSCSLAEQPPGGLPISDARLLTLSVTESRRYMASYTLPF